MIVGQVYRLPDVLEISRAEIAEFATAVGDLDPVYRDVDVARSRGHRDVPAPPTFLVKGLWRAVEPLLVDARSVVGSASMVHRDQRFDFARAVYAGDRLTAVVTVSRFATVATAQLLTARCDFATETGEPVCRTSSSLVWIESPSTIGADH